MPQAQMTADLLADNFVTEFDDDELHEQYDNMLDECHEQCSYVSASPSDLIKEHDPVAYRCGFNDWLDGESRDRLECVDDRYFDADEFNSFDLPWECDECGDECDESDNDGLCDTCEEERLEDEAADEEDDESDD